jgi:hypothetical protein
MKSLQGTIDLSVLPDMARTELIDFYEFLAYKYIPVSSEVKKERSKEKRFARFLAESIHVENWRTYTREELHER